MEHRNEMKVIALAWSRKKGTRKKVVSELRLIENFGVEGDAHAGDWHRQVSFLASESILAANRKGLDVTYGDFAENIATEGIDWLLVPIGTQLRIGDRAVVEITQIGKECHRKCAIFYQAGDCIMPREGVFARVRVGGMIRCGDPIEIVSRVNGEKQQAGESPSPSAAARETGIEEQHTGMDVVEWKNGRETNRPLQLLAEEPLSIRVQGKPYSVVMRTPGDERAHAAGFCLGEGLIDLRNEDANIGLCEGETRNVVTVTLTAARLQQVADRLDHRQFISQSSCGICGRDIVADLFQHLTPLTDDTRLEIPKALACLNNLSQFQPLREHTRAAHAAAVFDRSYRMISAAEDVGRHNALDKAVGKLVLANRVEHAGLLVLSSRISYEMVQKAARARIPVTLAVSRPTTLAVALAEKLGMTLGCLSGDDGLLVFTCPHRLIP